jgi:hypothetical protein
MIGVIDFLGAGFFFIIVEDIDDDIEAFGIGLAIEPDIELCAIAEPAEPTARIRAKRATENVFI